MAPKPLAETPETLPPAAPAEPRTVEIQVGDGTAFSEPQPTQAAPSDLLPGEGPSGELARLDRGLAWVRCGPEPGRERVDQDLIEEQRRAAFTYIKADQAEIQQNENLGLFEGRVELQRADQAVEADFVRYHAREEQPHTVDAEGQVFYQQHDLRLLGKAAHIELGTDKGWMDDAEYRLPEANARGFAQRIDLLGPGLARFEDISYTTCRPGDNAWAIEASQLDTDTNTGLGTARHAKLRIKDVPVLYFPYAKFPIDDRRMSGFLAPSFGSSDETGFEAELPYYWNIAPNMDATFTPRILTDRGLMLRGEYRYLFSNNTGEIGGEFLPKDDKSDKDNRGSFSFEHQGSLTPRLRVAADVNYVSDKNYLEEFGNGLSFTSQSHLERRGDIRYNGSFWSFLGRVQSYQTVDDTIKPVNQPYARLPQALFNLEKPDELLGLTYHLDSELVYFDHDEKVKGGRFDIRPGVSLPLRRSYGYLTPKFSLRHTTYQLQDEPSGGSDSPSRTLPTLSMDSGLIFDRRANWANNPVIQTLEPRLFYLYTPNDNQDDIPVFDTTEYDFSYSNLFRENRFSGGDRVGDANQLTMGLTSRMFDSQSGNELFRASLGQILYFEDRRVTLPGTSEETDNTSSIVADIGTRLSPRWSTRAGIQWDPHDKKTELGEAQIHYQNGNERIVNLAYRFRDGLLEQTDVSGRWPLTSKLYAVGRWNYSLRDDRTLESFGGLEYESCCWILRAVVRRYVNDTEGDANNSVFLQLVLRGFTSIGDKLDKFLERGILGYQYE